MHIHGCIRGTGNFQITCTKSLPHQVQVSDLRDAANHHPFGVYAVQKKCRRTYLFEYCDLCTGNALRDVRISARSLQRSYDRVDRRHLKRQGVFKIPYGLQLHHDCKEEGRPQ
jgi:hypothetical protein